MNAAESPAVRPPTTAEVYAWQEAQFGRGDVRNYALVVVEEVTEAVDVLHDRDHGLALPTMLTALREELGDVMVTLHSFAGFEGFELAVPDDPTVGGVWEVRAAMVRDAGKLARAVLKRAQGIRDREQTWSAQARYAAGRLMRAAASMAALHDLDPAQVITERWALVSSRDATGHRPAEDERRVAREAIVVASPTVPVDEAARRTDEREPGSEQSRDWLAEIAEALELPRDAGPLAVLTAAKGSQAITTGWAFEAERDAARASLAGVAEALGWDRVPRDEARGDWAGRLERHARLIYRQHQAQQDDEERWGLELGELRSHLTDLQAAVRAATGCESGEELQAVENGAEQITELRQYVVDALARGSDDHTDVRGIVSRAGQKIAELHARVDGMRDQLCRAVGVPLISDDGPDARWARAVELARKHWPENAQGNADREQVRAVAGRLGLPPYPRHDELMEALQAAMDAPPKLAEAEPEPRPWVVGDRVAAVVSAPPGTRTGTVRWPGTVTQLGPAGPAHGILPFLPDGWVRVALDPAPDPGPTPHAVTRGWIDRSPDEASRLLTRMEDDRG